MPPKTSDPYESYFSEAPADSTAAAAASPTSPTKSNKFGLLKTAGGLGGAMAGGTLSPEAAAAGAAIGLLGGPAAPLTVPLGAMIGGAIPPIAGAYLGGTVGETARQHLNRAMGNGAPEGQDALGQIDAAGMDQALQEIYGRFLMKGVQGTGKVMLAAALKSTPEIAKVAIREGVTATKAGLVRLSERLVQTANAERGLANAATRNGSRVQTGDVATAAYDEVRKKLRGAPPDEIAELARLHNQFVKQHPNGITPRRLLVLRKYYDRASSPQYVAADAGKYGPTTASKLWNKEIGDQARAQLRKVVPNIDDPATYERLTKSPTTPAEIVKLKSVLTPIVNRSPSVTRRIIERGGPGAVGGTIGYTMSPENRVSGAVRGAAIGTGAGLALSPQVLSTLGLGAHNPILAMLLNNLPRLVQGASE